ncbi:hypothetical protein ABPG72_001999 [Tetrahymena utriculariae]
MSDYDLLNDEEIEKLQDEIIREHEEEIKYLSNKSASSQQKDISLMFQQSQQRPQQQLSQQEEELLSNMPFNKSTFASAHTILSKNASEMKFQESQGEQRDLNTFTNRNNGVINTKSSKDNRLDTELEYSTFNGQSKSQETQKENQSSRKNIPIQRSMKKANQSTEKGISEGQFDLLQNTQRNQEDIIQDMKQYIQDLEQELSFLRQAQNQYDQLWKDNQNMKIKEVKLAEYIIELQNKLENQSNSIRNSTIQKIDDINNDLLEKNITIQQQNILIQELQHQISRLKENNDGWKSQIEKERQENQELRTYREKNEEQREDHDENRKYKDLYMEIYEQYQEHKISSQNKAFQQEQEIQSLISQLNKYQSNCNYEQELQNKNNEILELEQLIEKKDSQIQDMDQTFQQAKDEISQLNSQIELLKDRAYYLEQELLQKENLIDELQNQDFEEKQRNFLEKEQLFDTMANNVCIFINDLRKSQCFSVLEQLFHENFLQSILNHNVEILDYYQLDQFLSASLKQLESFMNLFINEKQEGENKIQYMHEADMQINKLKQDIEELEREREQYQPKAMETFQIQEQQKQIELLSLQKVDLEVKNKQMQESAKVIKGELEHLQTKYNNKIEKKRIFFEKMIESILKAVNSKQLNELCEEIIEKVKDIEKRKYLKMSIERKIQEIDAEIKINLAKQSQKDIEPLKKFKQQKNQELEDVLEKIKISNQKMWNAYEKMKETCLYEKRIKEDLVECERDYLRLKVQFEENRKRYENSSNFSKPNYTNQSFANQSKCQGQATIKTFKPPLKTTSVQQQQQFSKNTQRENDLIMHILSSDIQSCKPSNTARLNRESRSTSQIAGYQKQTQKNSSSIVANNDISQLQENYLTENLATKQYRNQSQNNRNVNNQSYAVNDTINDRVYDKQRMYTIQNERNQNDENDMNASNTQRESRQPAACKGSISSRQCSNNLRQEKNEVIMSLKDKLEHNKKNLSLNSRK